MYQTFDEIEFDSLSSKDVMFTAKLNFGWECEEHGALTEVRRKEGDRVVDKIPLNCKVGELYKSKVHEGKQFQDVSFIADIEFKNIRIAKYVKLEDDNVK